MDRLIDERYQLLRQIGSDDESTLYVASDMTTGHAACLRLWSHGSVATTLLSDGSRVHHPPSKSSDPRLIFPYDWGVDTDRLYVVREYIKGRNLRTLVDHEGPLAVGAAMAFAAQIADALSTAHADGLVHGRLRPSQIIVDEDGILRILGFGETIAVTVGAMDVPAGERSYGRETVLDETTSNTDSARGQQQDAYSVGSLAFYMLTTNDPFAAGPVSRPAHRLTIFRPLVASQHRPAVPSAVDDAVAFATTPDAHGHLPNMMDIAAHFRKVEREIRTARRARPGPAVAAMGGSRPAWSTSDIPRLARQLGDMQGYFALILMVGLAAGLFAVTLGKGKGIADAVVTPERTVAAEPTVFLAVMMPTEPVATSTTALLVPTATYEPTVTPVVPTETATAAAAVSPHPVVEIATATPTFVHRQPTQTVVRFQQPTFPGPTHTAAAIPRQALPPPPQPTLSPVVQPARTPTAHLPLAASTATATTKATATAEAIPVVQPEKPQLVPNTATSTAAKTSTATPTAAARTATPTNSAMTTFTTPTSGAIRVATPPGVIPR